MIAFFLSAWLGGFLVFLYLSKSIKDSALVSLVLSGIVTGLILLISYLGAS